MSQTTDQPAVAPAGVLVLDKPLDWTSHDCVAKLRRLLGVKKIGHAGTLDPAATGVLVAGVGRGTRFLTYLSGLDKAYTATIRLGVATTTDDAAGEVTSVTPAAALGHDRLEAGVALLTGDILQVPSSVSAIKVAGKRAYARVRAGETV
ncbi:MAG: tRNA pseudouridine(55) synthase TruB, partial [Bifidobacteriaceae bacterium]|nr:tRNA pseudouridine(55) synthase TruB [Bifidobacteriaceae bacterium]